MYTDVKGMEKESFLTEAPELDASTLACGVVFSATDRFEVSLGYKERTRSWQQTQWWYPNPMHSKTAKKYVSRVVNETGIGRLSLSAMPRSPFAVQYPGANFNGRAFAIGLRMRWAVSGLKKNNEQVTEYVY